ncbi:hypothetical protein MRX96_028984 [Rhipicephalus microplus]
MDAQSEGSNAYSSDVDSSDGETAKGDENKHFSILKFATLSSTQHATPVSSTLPQVGTSAQVPLETTTTPVLASRYAPLVAVEPRSTLAIASSAVPPSLPASATGLTRQPAPSIPPPGAISNIDLSHTVPAVSNPAPLFLITAPAVNPAVPLNNGVEPSPDNAIAHSAAQQAPSVQSVHAAASPRCPNGFPVVAMVLLALAFATVGLITFLAIFIEVWPEETDTADGSAKLTQLTDFNGPSTNEYTNTHLMASTKASTVDGDEIRRAGVDKTEDDEQYEWSTISTETPVSESPTPV